MKKRWLDSRESAVSLLKVFAILILALRLVQIPLEASLYNSSAGQMLLDILGGIAAALYQGGFIFALAWFVSLIGGHNADET